MIDPKMRRLATALSFFLLAPIPAALAQTTPDIVVTGVRPEQTQAYVEQVTAISPMADQLPRWDSAICTSIAGMPARQGQFLADRIAQRAASLGLRPGGPDCRANVAIFVTSDSDAFARQLFDRDRDMFAYYQSNDVSTLGQGALDDFLTTPRAVRWWHVSQTYGADGIALSGDPSIGGLSNAPSVRATGTRLSGSTREDFTQAIVIVDARRVRGVQLAALADYVSFVALAQVNAHATTSEYPTILNLFNGERANANGPAALTQWDQAYLDALYKSERNSATQRQQQSEIARRMNGN
ncbi:hypothetical protein [Candidatus Viadribacter manganicus]|uniref:Uncharacterized protein n=1 Tax=Candidatus Viadribacter manganicus TaxID=1759059 RepID=A0A1B1AJB8_9PROT|nr:hypothetical protein [Candidatus Viadribacter manganicus]ANP46647.1 hypothetical protein ATE48_12325 [Candidatus Viadribacter manganicus]